MGDKLEVLPGPGLVARYGDIAAWAGPQASPALQAHLVGEAQRTSQVPNGGDQFASSLIAVLQRGDPEPQAAFAVVGPGANGLTLFLHGPVQAWDSGRWLAPQPVPGWMVTSIGRPWPLIILPYGATPPPQSQQGNPFDLVVGAVPGSGFVLLRPPAGPGQSAGAVPQAAGAPQAGGATYGPTTGVPAATGPGAPYAVGAGAGVAGGVMGASPGGASPGGAGDPGAAGAGVGAAGGGAGAAALGGAAAGAAALGGAAAGAAAGTIAAGGTGTSSSPEGTGGVAPGAGSAVGEAGAGAAVAPGQDPSGAGQGPGGGTADLRNVFPSGRPPLPLASAWGITAASDLPEVPGVRCELGHFNHPRVP
ncbi:MAG TPA: hypothetical protein VEJ84_02295, partial [Acidimicrobiales bacterium]|nr:hypothetical protein [Acidimicrobiales bacterium]